LLPPVSRLIARLPSIGEEPKANAGKASMSTDVHAGRDGWLFLIGGSIKVTTLYDRQSRLSSDAKLHHWVKLIEARARRLQGMGIQYIHLNVPEKLTIYDHQLADPPMSTGGFHQRCGCRKCCSNRLTLMFSSILSRHYALRATASHSTSRRYPLGRAGLPCCLWPDLRAHRHRSGAGTASRNHQDHGAAMDLGMKLSPPVAEGFRIYDFTKNSVRTYANPIARYLDSATQNIANACRRACSFRNDAASAANKKLLVFGDSYALHSRTSLTGMLAETAREVEFIWSSNLDWRYIERAQPDVVVYELAERFITRVPNDKFSLRRAAVWPGLRAQWLLYKTGKRDAPGAKLV
jgi:hypothetical protein